ncbi:Protein NDR1 [Forsythia ovata]|uniref:Protein NDR1 n=1 Tax=Forsythia ovata TaxID=205694 RepID=A0ABD1P229_9LAMI
MPNRLEEHWKTISDPRYYIIKCCCALPFIIFFIWLGLNVELYKPRFYIQNIYVPALSRLDNSEDGRSNNLIFFDLELENSMTIKGVHYDNVNLTFFYGPNTGHPIGNYTVPEFYQGEGKKTARRDVVVTYGVPWDDAMKAVSNRSKVVFRLGLATKVKFKYFFLYSKKKGVDVGANVEVNDYGRKVQQEAIKLTSSGASRTKGTSYLNTMGLSVALTSLLVTSML